MAAARRAATKVTRLPATPARKPKAEPNTVELPARATERFLAAKRAIEQWSEVLKAARAEIEEAMGENEIGLLDGAPRIAWKHGKRTALNQKTLKDRYPDILEECKETTETRTLTVIEEGDDDGE